MDTTRHAVWAAVRSLREWWAAQLAPVAERIATGGFLRAAPASLALAMGSLVCTAAARLSTPIQHVAAGALGYRGLDFYRGALWKLPLSGLLAQSWPQWLWTLLMAGVLFAALEARIGAPALLACVFGAQVISTVFVAIVAPALGHAGELTRPDFGTSCLVVGAAGALAWVRRSRLVTAVMLMSLGLDALLSSPATAAEHQVAAVVGFLVAVAAAPAAYRGRRILASVPATPRFTAVTESTSAADAA